MLENGSVINNRYKILSFLGEGGMGSVYKVKDFVENRVIALKLIKEKILSEKSNQRFKNEFKLALELDHPNIVKVYNLDMYAKTNTYFFTMEYINGDSLGDSFMEINDNKKYEILLQIARGLNYIHSRRIVHFDIKPDNIFLVNNDGDISVKIVDFGLASILDEFGGKVRGTISYIAPEVLLKKEVDYRCDLYSFGMVIYHIFSGKLPFEDYTSIKSIAQAKTDETFFQESSFKNLENDFLRNLIADLCKARKENRIQSARQLISLLETGLELSVEKERVRPDDNLSNAIYDKNCNLEYLKKSYLNFLLRGEKRSGKLTTIISEKGNGKSQLLKKFNLQAQMNRIPTLFFRVNVESGDINLFFRKVLFGLYGYISESDKSDSFFDRINALIDNNGFFREYPDLIFRYKNLLREVFELLDTKYSPVVIIDDINNFSKDDLDLFKYFLRMVVTSPIFLIISVNESLAFNRAVDDFEDIFYLYPPDRLKISNLNNNDVKKYVSMLLSTDLENIDPSLFEPLIRESSGNKFLLKSYLSFLIEKNILIKNYNYYKFNYNFEYDYQSKIDDIYSERIKSLNTDEKFVLLFILERYKIGESFRNMNQILNIDNVEEVVERLQKYNLIDFDLERGGRIYYIKNDSLVNLIRIILLDENLKIFYDRLSKYYRESKYSISKFAYFFIRSSADGESKKGVLEAAISHCREHNRHYLLKDFLIFKFYNFDLDFDDKKNLLRELYKLLICLNEIEDAYLYYSEYLIILSYYEDDLDYADTLYDTFKFKNTKIPFDKKVNSLLKASKIYLKSGREKNYFRCIQKIISLYFREGAVEKGAKFATEEFESREKQLTSKARESIKGLIWFLKPAKLFPRLKIYNNIVDIYKNLELEYLNQEENAEIVHITLVNMISLKNYNHAENLADLYLGKVDNEKIEGIIINYIKAFLLSRKGELAEALEIYRKIERSFELRRGNRSLLVILTDIHENLIKSRSDTKVIDKIFDKANGISKYTINHSAIFNLYINSIEYNISKGDWIEVEILIRYSLAIMDKIENLYQLNRFMGLSASYYYLIRDKENLVYLLNKLKKHPFFDKSFMSNDIHIIELLFDIKKVNENSIDILEQCHSIDLIKIFIVRYVNNSWKNFKDLSSNDLSKILRMAERFKCDPIAYEYFVTLKCLVEENYKTALKITVKLGKDNYQNGYIFDCYLHILTSIFYFRHMKLYKNAIFFEDKFEKLAKRLSNKLGYDKRDRFSFNQWIY
ncbi:MAG: hypothetical protein CSA15_05980 [Candidatus Delongbacteria bacterium]|nr:MAG: hypothetical protein CSA15_05980 [Candidatus Delongbacteria bacterium]